MPKICIVAFSDKDENSIAYRKFAPEDLEKAVAFYHKMLANPDVKVISTRKTA